MGITEFDIIEKYFKQAEYGPEVLLGCGDDGALLRVPNDKQLVVTTDTLVAGIHFPQQTPPADIACKSIAVNLSDLAAMGAQPAWLMLSLTLPEADEIWLQAFADGFNETARDYQVDLIGGDTTRGPLSVTVQAFGLVDPGRAMTRDAARPGDKIYVTGTLGDAAVALKVITSDMGKVIDCPACVQRLNRPVARVAFASAAAKYCRCAIDISDGLLADLGHIMSASHCGAEVELESIPLSDEVIAFSEQQGGIDWQTIIAGGDDYELCLAVPEQHESAVQLLADNMQLTLTCIGTINDSGELTCLNEAGDNLAESAAGFLHFSQ